MAYLGLADEAREHLVGRARNRHPGSRFPAFWGPNYDWVPDQDHGGVLMRTLQSMLMQTEGRQIHLLPAWPREWDAAFTLAARGAFLISTSMKNREIGYVKIESRAGGECRVSNPWPGKKLNLYRNGKKTEKISGSLLTFHTTSEEVVTLVPGGLKPPE